ncbi:nicotinate-nicotinamide nucleotide adenylyltransferase [Vescimonas sanitatis]|uniref:nicotinate-nicotinamide nucleotide adenylyltransferase n=1 Tax=Vescimonas sanitatis TaxID=3376993 RepID=UPI003B7FD2E2
MNKKRIRQMDLALRRRLSDRPAADYFAPGDALLRTIESEGYMQRFTGLFNGTRLRCADVLALCRPELETLCPGEPSEGWLAYAYDYARRLLYPEKTDAEPFAPGAVFLLSVLQVLFAAEAELLPHDPAWTFDFLTDDELAGSPCAPSYQRFLRLWRREFVYELMRLGLEVTPYRTLEHIAGVHHLAVTAARALRKSGVAVDVALVSGAAAGHDLGKFGCRPGERVPYLHYFYTDQWFRRRRMTDIGHVAANHSVWDLEPDYLSVEALLLIYADFRVKQLHDAQGREITRISTLAQAFQVILDKLDDVDGEKQKRYTRVYARLEDFEQFMVSCGVDVTMSGGDTPPLPEKHTALMTDDEALRALTLRCVGHNMELMHRLTDQRSFARLLEEARGETDWRRLRAYLAVMESYSLYLHIPQKVQTLTFLYELLMHREGDIRRQAAALLGEIIAGFHAGYAKERPADIRPDPRAITDVDQWRLYLDKILYPDHKLMPQHRRWIGYTLKFAVGSLLSHCPGREERFLAPVFAYYRRPEDLDDYTAFQLLDTAAALPDTAYTASRARQMTDFAAALSLRKDLTIRMAAVLLLDRLARLYPEDGRALEAVTAVPDGDSGTLRYLKQDVLSQGAPLLLPEDVVSEIFLDNLKTATPWITKQGNLRLLTDFARSGKSPALHIATHLSNLIKVSDRVTVRHSAGNALLALAPRLTADQRNEVAVELCRGLELGQQEFTKYIPDYLGRFALWLPPAELDEVLDDLRVNLSSSDSRVTASVLDTVGVIYEAYDAYRSRFPETDDAYRRRRERLLGLLMRGLSGIDGATRQEALFVLGRRVFGSGELGRHEKRRAFMLTQRKLLSAQDEFPGEGLTFYYRAAMLGKLYRFITEERLFHKGFDFGAPRPVAFFPGTFDPFTLSHKGIVRAIRDQGFEVLLAIDEFSWSKKTQPYRLRRRIAAMAVADVFHVSIFPEDFPVNIANPENLHELRAAFPGRSVSIVVGSDVVLHASSYKKSVTPDSIHTFDHVVFRRTEPDAEPADYSCITGKVLELTLPPQLEEISSTRIREAVDANRDISNLIDPTVQEFIYRRGLYLREPQDKPVLRTEDLSFLPASPETAEKFLRTMLSAPTAAALRTQIESRGDDVMVCRDTDGTILGAASYACLDSARLFARLGDPALSGLVRQNAGGRTLLISGLFVPRGERQSDLCQLLITEVLTLALSREFTYALYLPLEGAVSGYGRQLLTLQGFVPAGDSTDALAVDMRCPIVLSRNVDTAVKAPFSSSPRVLAAIAAAHRRLQAALTKLQPGSLVLSLSAGVIYHRLLQRITGRNGVPAEPTTPRVLGPDICVPYGKILRGVAVPNTVTKTLRTDKVYEPDLSTYSIEAYPDYSPLPDQVRTIHAFARPVILVDDMLHDGKRIRRLAPLLAETNTPVDQVLVGYLTGMGRDLMEQLGYDVDAIYYLPNLRLRFVESTLYPFIGGDTVRRSEALPGGLQPAVNRILPYAAPEYTGMDDETAWELSLCCLENARDILLALETEFRSLYARNLTLSRLGEAVILPLCPDKGGCMTYDLSRAASTYLEGDIELLKRMRPAR